MGTVPPNNGGNPNEPREGNGLPPQEAPTVPDIPNAPAGAYGGYGSFGGYPPGQTGGDPYGGFGVYGPGGNLGDATIPQGTPWQWPASAYGAPIDYDNVVPDRMPRDRAVHLARRGRRWIVGLSAAAFLALVGLAAGNAVGVTAQSSSSNGASPSNSTTQPAVGRPGDDGENGTPFFGSQPSSPNVAPSNSVPPISGSHGS